MTFFYLLTTALFAINQAFCSDKSPQQEEVYQNYQFMDNMALSAGTDKSSNWHNYTNVYSQYFHNLKDEPLVFLEIGIYKGDSVKFWEQYFPNAELHFIDISASNIQYNSQRSYYHFIDQTNAPALRALGSTVGQFDVIIDDGGHTMDQQIISFKALFPFIKSKGIYVIEDLHTSYWKNYGGNGSPANPTAGKGTTVDFLQGLVDSVNFIGASTQCADYNKAPFALLKNMDEYQKSIESIHFYDSVCIIIKR